MRSNGITEKGTENLPAECETLPLSMRMSRDYLYLTELQEGQVGWGKSKGDGLERMGEEGEVGI